MTHDIEQRRESKLVSALLSTEQEKVWEQDIRGKEREKKVLSCSVVETCSDC